jgi:hypothetical protein
MRATAQYFVDCSGNTPGAYTTINSVLPLIGNGAMIQVIGTCTENVQLGGLTGIWMGAPWGQTMNLQGSLTINGTQDTFIYGMNVSSPSNNGIMINSSHGIALDTVTSTNNDGMGLVIGSASEVSIQNAGSFSNNANTGINVSGNSMVDVSQGSAPILVSNNVNDGVYAERSVFNVNGISITNNKAAVGSTSPSGFGVDFRGAARGVFCAYGVPNTITGNQGGGISLQENAEISLCGGGLFGAAGQANIVQGNGPIGISVGFGSQLTLFDAVQVTGHTDAGVEVFGNSQAYIYGNNQISNNGSDPTYPARAGVRVDGNSEAYLRGGQISQNGGPGILAIVNSSLDFQGMTFGSNSDGDVLCDSSSYMVSDLANSGGNGKHGSLITCTVPNTLGNRAHAAPVFHIPDSSRIKAAENQYKLKMSTLY